MKRANSNIKYWVTWAMLLGGSVAVCSHAYGNAFDGHERRDETQRLPSASSGVTITDPDAGVAGLPPLPEKVQSHIATPIPGSGVKTLPLVEYYAPGSDRLAIMISGDGGWRTLDRNLSKELQRRGISVVGWNSLRYFWKLRTPEQLGDDLSRVIADYQRRWGTHQVILIGYSFGADVMPFAYAHLMPMQRNDVDFISLLAPGRQADFKARIFGRLGWGEHGTQDVLTALGALDLQRVQCVYGQNDKDAVCSELRERIFDVVMRPGGHHFDDNTVKLADAILQGWQQRLEVREPRKAGSHR
ncbi:AcvB/VirJ family lysyl-phosphatidylglycerol hydrolase [Xylella fastidiosa]|uniref:Virulence factor family protein n=1 Tax=Xylella fastidiosa subsp. fastidiosa TaxID=644356 RepID=A0AAJ5R2S7_XYLFS|nr:AcvB/VirJ family lysyl-phosphatidylglycerol hydrolase [Xylella fastidiosa]WCF28143.1 virulence factor family protein [Xylella fastidiosa subsp. fastidiosa]